MDYHSREEAESSLRQHGKENGFGVCVLRSDRDKRVTFGCDRSGHYRDRWDHGERQRDAKTRLIGCPFRAKATKGVNLRWSLELLCEEHNHELSGHDLSSHPSLRKLDDDQAEMVVRLSSTGSKASSILTSLRQEFPQRIHATARTIYNIQAKARVEALGGRTPSQALLDELQSSHWEHDYKLDSDRHVTHLFFASPTSVEMTREYRTAFVMDCTYKTNR